MTSEHEQWLAERRKGIGGSDAAALFGVSPWESPFSLYQAKVGNLPPKPDSPAMEWGRRLEPVVREAYAEKTGRTVKDGVVSMTHREAGLAFMLANTDGQIIAPDHSGEGVYEGKTTTVFRAREWNDGQIPLYYQIQVQHYLEVLGLQWASIAVLLMGAPDPFVWRDVERNDRFVEALCERERAFWHKHVVPRNPPPLDASKGTTRALKELHPKDNGRVIFLPSEAGQWHTRRGDIAQEVKALEEERALLDNRIRDALGGASYGEIEGGGGFSYKSQRRGKSEFRVLRTASEKSINVAKKAMSDDDRQQYRDSKDRAE